MKNEKKQTAVEWFFDNLNNHEVQAEHFEIYQQAKEMEKEQRGYTKEDVIKAGEMGEINHHDTKHIVTCLDEAKEFNETYGGNEQ